MYYLYRSLEKFLLFLSEINGQALLPRVNFQFHSIVQNISWPLYTWRIILTSR